MLSATASKFDLSDVGTLDDVLTVAAEIIDENASDPGSTRIERLARFVSRHLGCEPSVTKVGAITMYAPVESQGSCDVQVTVVGTRIAVMAKHDRAVAVCPLSKENAISLAVALLRAAEAA